MATNSASPRSNRAIRRTQPDAFERQRARERSQKDAELSEYYAVDKERNALRYLRPIRLTQECLLCHGNPANSKTLWGNDQGLDPTGAQDGELGSGSSPRCV